MSHDILNYGVLLTQGLLIKSIVRVLRKRMTMIRKVLIVLVLLGTMANASALSDYEYHALSSNPIFTSDTKVREGFSFDVDFGSLLGAVDKRFETDYLVNAPKRINPLTPFITLSYRF